MEDLNITGLKKQKLKPKQAAWINATNIRLQATFISKNVYKTAYI